MLESCCFKLYVKYRIASIVTKLFSHGKAISEAYV